MNQNEQRVAWVVECTCPAVSSIAFATTGPKARYLVALAYWEAGYGSRREWPRLTSARAPRFDRSRLNDGRRNCYTREYVEGTL